MTFFFVDTDGMVALSIKIQYSDDQISLDESMHDGEHVLIEQKEASLPRCSQAHAPFEAGRALGSLENERTKEHGRQSGKGSRRPPVRWR